MFYVLYRNKKLDSNIRSDLLRYFNHIETFLALLHFRKQHPRCRVTFHFSLRGVIGPQKTEILMEKNAPLKLCHRVRVTDWRAVVDLNYHLSHNL